MRTLAIRLYQAGDAAAWDELVARSANGTFLHSRRYLGYHGDRFTDRSLVVSDGDRLVGVLPAALQPNQPDLVVSHPGITYGGLVQDGTLRGEELIGVLRDAAACYREQGCTSWRYKAVPHIYHREPAEDDLYALFRLGGTLYRRDLSATVDLAAGTRPRGDRRRNPRLAARRGAAVVADRELLPAYWDVLADALGRRHGARPVHTVAEMQLLLELFPEQIEFAAVVVDGAVVAGTVHYLTDRVLHCQYSAASPAGASAYALDLAFAEAIAGAAARGLRWYDFGISTESGGTVLNASLYDFKTSFGARGTVSDFYQLALDG